MKIDSWTVQITSTLSYEKVQHGNELNKIIREGDESGRSFTKDDSNNDIDLRSKIFSTMVEEEFD
ncbi:MAG: hypothetical protein R3A45_10315 [Bdellovibrionota bacterium]